MVDPRCIVAVVVFFYSNNDRLQRPGRAGNTGVLVCSGSMDPLLAGGHFLDPFEGTILLTAHHAESPRGGGQALGCWGYDFEDYGAKPAWLRQ